MLKKIQKIIIFLVFAYSLLGFIVLPLVLKSQLVKIVQQQTNAKISLDSIDFNPFIFKIKINDIKLKDAKDAHLFSLKSIVVNLEPSSLLMFKVHIKNIILEKPEISFVYNKDKSINLTSILKPSIQKPQEDNSSTFKMPRIVLDKVAIVEGRLKYEDFTQKTKFDFSFENIGFELKDIDTADFNTSNATLKFYAALGDGGFFDINSQIIGFKPFMLKGSVNFEASRLYTEWKYMQDSLNLEVADGKMKFFAEYFFNIDDLNATSINNLNVSIDRLRIKPKDKYKDVLNLEHLLVSDVDVKPMKQDIHVGKIIMNSLAIKVKRDANKSIDWLEYIKTDFKEDANTTSKQTIKTQETSKPWNVLVDDVSLEKIKVDFNDFGVKPNVTTTLNDLNIYLKNVTLAGKEALKYNVNLRLNEDFTCNSSGEIKYKILDVNSYIQCSNLDIVKFRPYIDELAKEALSVYDIELQEALLSFDANVKVLNLDDKMQVNVSDANLNLSKFALDKISTKERIVDFTNFKTRGLSLNTKEKAISIQDTTLENLNIQTALYKNGSLNIDNLIAVKEVKTDKKTITEKANIKDADEKEYQILLKHFALKSAKVRFKDSSLKSALTTKFDNINFNAYNIDSKAKTWLDYDFSARLNSKGYVTAKGKLRHTPLKEKGTIELKKISLKEFSPYVEKNLYAKLTDGYINSKMKLNYEKDAKKPDLRINGKLDIDKFYLYDSRDNSKLITFNKMVLKSFDYEMFPNKFYVNEVDLDGFYVNAIIDENKNMNLSTLLKRAKVKKGKSKKVTTKSQDNKSDKFPFKIMKLNIASGDAKFMDLSLPIKFKTDIHNLNGIVNSISSKVGEVSKVDISGNIDKYGSTKLKGSIDSSNPKLYTDLNFNFRNLDLHSMSGYSADFAGYKIKKGKLYLDLKFDIVDSKLLGKNSLIIKNIELGDEIKDENITSLPIGFAIALLEDSDEVININMPVSGNVDAPDFKYGALVWKTFANLILKAVTFPFDFLGSMMGIDGEKLSYINFEPGLITILPSEKEKLDNISAMMTKRPKIFLKIMPQYDEIQDAKILKQEKLIKSAMKISGIKDKKEQQNMMNEELLESIYKQLAPNKEPKLLKQELQKSYKEDALNRAYVNVLLDKTTQMQTLTQTELEDLAIKRANLLKEELIAKRGLDAKRVIVLKKVQNVNTDKDTLVKTKLEINIE